MGLHLGWPTVVDPDGHDVVLPGDLRPGTMATMTNRGLISYPAGAFNIADVVAAKVRTATTISVCIPARNEETTVAGVVGAIRAALVTGAPLVDEIVVIDDHSSDATAEVAAGAGARVVDARSVLADHGPGHGKGEALWKSLRESTGEVVAWVDADIVDFDPIFVTSLVGPLLVDPGTHFVKGGYRRPEADGVGGGRTTELLARPLLSQLFPELADIAQPLGECAGRRVLLEHLPFVVGYGVDVALLIDAWRAVGIGGIAQVDLGVRHHRNRTLDELGPQALAVSQAILDRAGLRPPGPAVLRRPGKDPLPVAMHERPPLTSLRPA
ncbi:glucosyl-3-phosphoglycerate synthase [soil metagenome]